MVAGFVALWVGWDRAAQQQIEVAQIPYVISGGLGGLALVFLGSISFGVGVVGQMLAAHMQSVDHLADASTRMSEELVATRAVFERRRNAARRRNSDGEDEGDPEAADG